MAEYLGTHGSRIQNYTTDPDNPNTGEVWYNSTTQTLKVNAGTLAGNWTSGGNLGTARYSATGAGTQTAALGFGGYIGPVTGKTEAYNGTNWTSGGMI